MKKKNLLILPLLLLTFPALPGTSVIPGGRDISQKEVAAPKQDVVEAFLEQASSSYTLTARENETVYSMDGSELYSNTYQYSMAKEEGRSREVYLSPNGESTITDVVRDSKGKPATEYLGYNNVVQTHAISSTSYDLDYANPFLFLEPEDFTPIDEGVYRLNPLKYEVFSYYLLRLSYGLETIDFTFDGYALKDIVLTSPRTEVVIENAYTGNYMKAEVGYTTRVLFSDIGSTQVDGVSKATSRDEENEVRLELALAKLKDNFTIIMNEHDRDSEGNPEFDSYWYFDGESIYHQQQIGDTSGNYDLYYTKEAGKDPDKIYLMDLDEDTGEWIHYTAFSPSSYNADPKSYDDLLPKYATLSRELFRYDAQRDVFVCDNADALPFLGNPLLPGCYAISYFTQGGCDKCEIKLKSDGTVDTITVGYSYVDSQGFPLERDMSMRFANVGTTKMPAMVR